jgi:ubiquinone/menaquinone biosynthesis C-methylase UbiE
VRFYRHFVFPRLLDLAMSSRAYRRARIRTLAPASGSILEIGFGTGANLEHYPAGVRRIEAIDPDPFLDRYSRPRIDASSIEVSFHHLDAEHLPFEDERFDTVVSTLTFCSIPDPVHALSEVRRVLRPGGQFLFMEHGRDPRSSVARWQDRLTPLWKPLAGGCCLNRPVLEQIERVGLVRDVVRSGYLRGVPTLLAYVTEGVARKPGTLQSAATMA